jgi:hypothetical protein
MELLPPKPEGNSMLEFKQALMSLGFEVEPQKLTVEEIVAIRVPSVILILPPQKLEGAGAPPMGHYLVLWPLDRERVKIMDYPRDPIVVSFGYLARHIRRAGITRIPALLCGQEGQSLEEMLLPSRDNAKISVAPAEAQNR